MACRSSHYMCLPHWRMVPVALQRDVWRTYRAWDREVVRYKSAEQPSAVQAVVDAAAALRSSQAAALAAVTEKLIRKALKASESQAGLGF